MTMTCNRCDVIIANPKPNPGIFTTFETDPFCQGFFFFFFSFSFLCLFLSDTCFEMCAVWLTFGCYSKLMLALPFGFCLFSVFRLVCGPISIFAICLCSVRFFPCDELMLLATVDTIKCCYSYFDSLPTGQVTELEF